MKREQNREIDQSSEPQGRRYVEERTARAAGKIRLSGKSGKIRKGGVKDERRSRGSEGQICTHTGDHSDEKQVILLSDT